MILVLNAGSSSIKFALYDMDLALHLSGSATEIGGASKLRLGDDMQAVPLATHAVALGAILKGLDARGHRPEAIRAAGHRAVHGGPDLKESVRITPETKAVIDACTKLAPLHNPHILKGIDALTAAAPDLLQVAVFDTAFHATNPEVAVRYALPDRPEMRELRRYGFHGISYAGLTQEMAARHGGTPPERLLALHLGNGASLCAIKDGASVATTMGYSPLSGLTMGTRTGDIDGNLVLRLAEEMGLDEASAFLNRESGLLGLGGASDMRALHGDPSPEAQFAVQHFIYWCIRHAGSMIAAMGGLDAVAFTGGIGENDRVVRAGIADGLAWTGLSLSDAANQENSAVLHADGSAVEAHRVTADEERTIAAETLALIET